MIENIPPPPEGAEQRRLVLAAQAGDLEARNEMMVRNMGLVAKHAKYYARRNPGVGLDDLLQAGRIGLERGVMKFNVDKGYKFSTYSVWWIRNELRRLVRLENARGVSASMKDASDFMEGKMSARDSKHYEAACLGYIPLEEPAVAGDHGSDKIRDIIVSDYDLVEESENKLLYSAIRDVFRSGKISGFQQSILCMHYGIGVDSELTLKQIRFRLMRDGYDLTESGIQSVIDNALEVLREELGA